MNDRQRLLAVLNYQPYDRLPIVHFGYWTDTLEKWAAEGHITQDQAKNWADGNPVDAEINQKLGFDFDYYTCLLVNTHLLPPFEREVIEECPDGSRKVLNPDGVIILEKKGAVGIPPEIDHMLKSRREWEESFLPRLQFSEDRFRAAKVRVGEEAVRFDEGGLEFLQNDSRDFPYGLYCGSLFGRIRDMIGMTGCTYIYAEDEALFDEMIRTVGDLCYRCTEAVLKTNARFDFAHFWEDICFKNGPLISPAVFEEKVGPYYRKLTQLVNSYGIEIVSLDCDGLIDALVPTWFNNGVNTMFPIEVGTWNASVAPWRKQFGRGLRGVGGMNKNVLARDRAAIDAEIERLRPLVDLGGYLPCPDHRIAPDGEWDNVRYYCDRMRKVFG